MANHNYLSKYFKPQELVPKKVYDTLGAKSYCLFEKNNSFYFFFNSNTIIFATNI